MNIILQHYRDMIYDRTLRPKFLKMFSDLFSDLIISFSMSVLVPLQLAFIKNVNEKIGSNFKKLKFDTSSEEPKIDWKLRFENRINDSKWFYVLIFLIMSPFIIIFRYYYIIFYFKERTPNMWVLVFDIYNNFLGLLILVLFAVMLWIIIIFALSLRDLTISPYRDLIILDVINLDNMGD